MLSLIGLLVVSFPLMGVDSSNFLKNLPAESLARLYKAGELTTFGQSLKDMIFLKSLPSRQALETEMANFPGTITVEALFWMPLNQIKTSDTLDLGSRVYRGINSFSKMKGLQYYSVSRKRTETLILESYLVQDEKTKKLQNDGTDLDTGMERKALLLQKDNTFGENIYSISISGKPELYTLSMNNKTPMYWGILPLVDPDNFRMRLQVVVLDDGVLFYGLSSVKTLSVFGLERSKEDSFYNRLKALADWLRSQLKV